jgi:hypothetical protein
MKMTLNLHLKNDVIVTNMNHRNLIKGPLLELTYDIDSSIEEALSNVRILITMYTELISVTFLSKNVTKYQIFLRWSMLIYHLGLITR